MNKAEYVERFTAAMSKWSGGKSFMREGGVPGCRILQTTDVAALANWFFDGAFDPWHFEQWARTDPEGAVHYMAAEDAAYSPDY